MRELYVYYRIASADTPACEALVRAFQARLMADETRLRARLLVRPETSKGEQTWMETYAVAGDPPAGVDAALEARIGTAAQALAPHLRSPRHVEVFIVKA